MTQTNTLADLVEPTADQIEQLRSDNVRRVVEQMQAENAHLSHGNVAKRLPADFEYDNEADSYERFLPPAPGTPEQCSDVPTHALHARAHAVEVELFEAREALRAAEAARKLARAEVARTWSNYRNGGVGPVSDSQLRRDFIAASAAEREDAKARGRVNIPPGGASPFAIDSSRARWGSNPEGFAAKLKATRQAADATRRQQAATRSAIDAAVHADRLARVK